MAPVRFPEFRFSYFPVSHTIPGEGGTYITDGICVVARCCPPRPDVFVVCADDREAALRELMVQLDDFQAQMLSRRLPF